MLNYESKTSIFLYSNYGSPTRVIRLKVVVNMTDLTYFWRAARTLTLKEFKELLGKDLSCNELTCNFEEL